MRGRWRWWMTARLCNLCLLRRPAAGQPLTRAAQRLQAQRHRSGAPGWLQQGLSGGRRRSLGAGGAPAAAGALWGQAAHLGGCSRGSLVAAAWALWGQAGAPGGRRGHLGAGGGAPGWLQQGLSGGRRTWVAAAGALWEGAGGRSGLSGGSLSGGAPGWAAHLGGCSRRRTWVAAGALWEGAGGCRGSLGAGVAAAGALWEGAGGRTWVAAGEWVRQRGSGRRALQALGGGSEYGVLP
jgi:hypothetical protein